MVRSAAEVTAPVSAEARKHVEMLHRLAEPLSSCGKLVVAGYGEDPDGTNPKTGKPGAPLSAAVEHFQIGDIEGMLAAVQRLGRESHRNVYMPLAVLRGDLPRGKKGQEVDVIGVLGFVIDDDPDRDRGATELLLPANYVLQTSATPQANRQLFYLLDEILSVEEAKPIAETLTDFHGTDHGSKDLSHVWRVPGCLNWPSAKKVHELGRPSEPQRVTVLQPWEGSLTAVADLRAALDERGFLHPASGTGDNQRRNAASAPHTRSATSPHSGGLEVPPELALKFAALPDWLQDKIVRGRPEGERSDALFDVIANLHRGSWTKQQIHAVIAAHPGGIGAKYADRDDLDREIDRVLQRCTPASSEPVRWPEPAPLTRPIPPAPEFPVECLPQVLAGIVLDEAERMQCAPDLLAIPGLVTLAGCIGKDATIRPKAQDDWAERACVWAMVIQPPGSMKSQAIAKATAPLRRIQMEWSEHDARKQAIWEEQKAEADLRLKAWERQCKELMKEGGKGFDVPLPEKPKVADELGERPAMRRLITQDATLEKLADIMVRSRGLSLVRDELAAFLLNLGRYNAGSDRQFYLEAYSGGSYAIDRIGRGEQFVSDLYLNICGGIQPTVATRLFSGDAALDDGFFERFGLLAYPEVRSDWEFVDRWPDGSRRLAFNQACDRLASANWYEKLHGNQDVVDGRAKPFAGFDNEAQLVFNDWLKRHMRELPSMGDDPLAGFMSKARGLLCRLVLTIHLGAWTGGEEPEAGFVTRRSLERALKLLEDYLVPTWRRVLAAFGRTEVDDGAYRIAQHILKARPDGIRIADVTKQSWRGLTDRAAVEAAFEKLASMDWLLEPERPSGARGRPSATYRINPRVYGCGDRQDG